MTKSMGTLLKMMQGGTDRTGFADMADEYAFTPRAKEPDIEELLASLDAQNNKNNKNNKNNQTIEPELSVNENALYDMGGDALSSGFGGLMAPGGLIGKLLAGTVGMSAASNMGEDYYDNIMDQVGVPEKIPEGSVGDNDIFGLGKFYKDIDAQGDGINQDLTKRAFRLYADGGRVEMQQGGMPGGMAMPGLLGVASGSSGNLFDNYMPNPSAVPGPNYNTYQAPQLTSLASPYSGAQFGDIGDYLGGPDPYAVAYNPYVDMGGSAYDQYGMGMTQEDIDKVFADTDKFSLAAQEAKRKAAEAAAAAAARRQNQNTGGGGGNNPNSPGNNPFGNSGSTSGSTSASPGSSGTSHGGSTSGGPPGTGAEGARDGGNPGGYNEGGSVQNLLLSLLGNNG